MSTAIDKRIVEMVFNNKDFMKNMTSTSKALESFDGQIEDLGQTTAFDKVAKATEPMGVAIEAVGAKAVILQELIGKVTGKIVDSIFGMVNKVQGKINELTFDQVGAGFNKYEEKIKSVQTIMNATGESIDVVNEQLAKLMWYSDETSYSFTDMTSNVGKFTSVGISLDDSVTAMMGIANWAALSGAGVQEASRAMYNFSQAMGAGVMMTKDWVSIENANMATKEFKETVIETAKELKAAGKLGEDYDFDLDSLTFEGFRDSLSEGWFTKPIMEEALKKYGNYTEELYKIKQEFEEAGEYKTVDELKEIYDERFRESADLYNAVKEAYAKYGKESKEFRDVVNQNGVTMQTALDLIQEKQNEEFNEKLQVDAEALKKAAEEFGVNSDQFKKAAQDAGYSIEDATEMVEKGVTKFQKAVKSVSERGFAAGQEAKTFTDAWEAAKDAVSSQWATLYEQVFGNYEEAKIMWTALANTMWDVFAGPIEQLNAIIGLWVELGGREKLFDVESGAIANIWNGLTEVFDAIKTALIKVFPVFEHYESFSYILYDLTDRFHKFTEGLTLDGQQTRILTTVFKGLFSILKFVGNTIKTIGTSLGMIFKSILPESLDWQKVLKFIRDMIQKLDTTSNSFYINTMKFTGLIVSKIHAIKNLLASLNLGERFENLKDSLGKTFEDVKTKITSFGDTLKSIGTKLGIFKSGMEDVKTVGEAVNETTTKISDTIGSKLKPILDKLQPAIKKNTEGVKSSIDLVAKAEEIISSFCDKLLSLGKTILDVIKNIIGGILNMNPQQMVNFFSTAIFGSVLVSAREFISSLKKVKVDIKNISDMIKRIGNTISDTIKSIGDAKKLEAYSELFRSIAISMLIFAGAMLIVSAIPADDVAHTLTLLAAAFSELIVAYYVITQTASDVIQAAAMKEATNSILKLGVAILLVAIAMSGFTKLNTEQVRNGVIGLAACVAALIAFYGSMTLIANQEEKAPNIEKRIIQAAKSMIKMALAVGILSLAVRIMGTLDLAQLGKGLAGVGVLLVWMYAFMAGMDKMLGPTTSGEGLFTETSGGGLDVKKLLAVGVAMNLIAGALIALMVPVELMAHLSLEQLGKGLGGVLVLIIEMAALFEFLSAKVGTDMGAGKILAIAFAMDLMAAAFTTLMIPVELMAHMGLDQLAKGLIGMLVLIIEVAALFEFLSVKMETMGVSKLFTIAFVMTVMSAAMIALAIPVIALGRMLTGEELLRGLIGITVLLAEIGIFVKIFTKAQDASLQLTEIGGAMMMIAMTIKSMAETVQILGTLSVGDIFKGIIAMGVLMGIMVAFAKLLDLIQISSIIKLAAISVCFQILSKGISLLGDGILKFNEVGVGAIITTLITIAAVIGVFAALAAALSPVLLPMLGLALILPLIGAGLLLFVLGIKAMIAALNAGNPFIQIVEMISQAMDEFIEWYDLYGQDFVENHLLPFLKTAITAFGEALWSVIGPVYEYVVDWLSDLFLKIEHKVKEKMEDFKQNWKDGWNLLTQPIKDWIDDFKENWYLWWDAFVATAINPFKEFGENWANFWKGIGEKVYDAVSFIEEDVKRRFQNAIDNLTEFFSPFFDKISEWIEKIKELKEGLSEDWNGFWDNWKHGVDDLGAWMFGDPNDTKQAGQDAADAAIDGLKEGFDINSPSKKAEEEVGVHVGEGVVKGTTEAMTSEDAKKQMSNAGTEAMNSATDAMVDNLLNGNDTKSKIIRKIADALGIDVGSLVQKYGSADGILAAMGIDVNTTDLENLDVNSLLKQNGIDTSGMTVDTSNLTLSTDGVTLDTSNIALDNNGQNVDLENVGYNFDDSQITTLAEAQGMQIADGMAEGYAQNGYKVTDEINNSITGANTNVDFSGTSTNANTINMVKRIVDGQEIMAEKTLDLVSQVKQDYTPSRAGGRNITKKVGFPIFSNAMKIMNDAKDKKIKENTNDALKMATSSFKLLDKVDKNAITNDTVKKFKSAMDVVKTYKGANDKEQSMLQNSVKYANYGVNTIKNLDEIIAKKKTQANAQNGSTTKTKTGTTSTSGTTGSSYTQTTGTTASSAAQSAASATDYLRAINDRANLMYNTLVTMDARQNSIVEYLGLINDNTYACATTPIPATIDQKEVKNLAKSVNLILGMKAELSKRGV